MRYSTIQFRPIVTAALDGLKAPVREAVLKEIHDRLEDPASRPTPPQPGPLEGIYEFAPTIDPGLRVLYRIHDSDGVAEVLDLVRPDALRAFFRGPARLDTP